ncbi:protein translocase subunit SecD [uncultured Maricaulis sp.]|uniref:protein translocase subunit SecD n=1 Tax=uncultured Maricaulis sp. TaxID=174710 RepID=UPI0030DDB14F|tara:strand:- start:1651 stop:3309 length:1659 start_codon:yes stop_codon:yes gene_type:complete
MLQFGRWKLFSIIAVIFLGVLYSLPNLVPESDRYSVNEIDNSQEPRGIWRWIPSKTVNLGLDLQGGSHIVFEVNMAEVREGQLETLAADARQTLRAATPPLLARSVAVVGDEVVVLMARPDDRDAAYDVLSELSQPVSSALGQPGLTQTLDVRRDGSDLSAIRLGVTPEQLEAIRTRTVTQSIEVIRRRLDGLGTTDPTIARQGDSRVLVQVPGASDPDAIIAIVGAQASMSFHLVDETINPGPNGQARVPPGRTIYPMASTNPPTYLAVETASRLTGENLTSASVSTSQTAVGPVVAFRFDTQGALVFGDMTRNNVGKRFAIVLDGEIITAPNIRGPILGGSGIIEGNFTYETAQQLVVLLNAGALPASLTPVEQRTVLASLGQDQIESGELAVLVGFLAVIVFMIAAYGLFGVFATIALMVNVILIMGALSGLGATLTLPGIAGIILTIGMAVDANVLIYERIREENKLGRTPANALQAGYERALSAILDANVTTFIAAAVLYMLGAGPVRGFAITLAIGIITSVFTAFVFSRLLAVIWLRAFKPKAIPL